MQNEQSSIFNREFLLETYTRRRKLMPLVLKIYVWFFLVISALYLLSVAFLIFTKAEGIDAVLNEPKTMISALAVILLIALMFLSGIFILLERKWGILFAWIVTGLTILLFSASLAVHLYQSQFNLNDDLALQAGWILVMLPYFVLLLKIRPDWENKAVAGNQLKPSH